GDTAGHPGWTVHLGGREVRRPDGEDRFVRGPHRRGGRQGDRDRPQGAGAGSLLREGLSPQLSPLLAVRQPPYLLCTGFLVYPDYSLRRADAGAQPDHHLADRRDRLGTVRELACREQGLVALARQ